MVACCIPMECRVFLGTPRVDVNYLNACVLCSFLERECLEIGRQKVLCKKLVCCSESYFGISDEEQ